MRIASYNVENLFARAKVLDADAWEDGAPIIRAQAELTELLQRAVYDAPTRSRILQLLDTMGILRSDESEFVRLRKIRGQLLRRPRSGPVDVVATGRADWVGWVELKTERVNEWGMQHTAMVIRDVRADILGVVEAESRPVLTMFSDALLRDVGGNPYHQVMLVDGNDDRGIDVGILARAAYPLLFLRTHVFYADYLGTVFSRDCAEYHFATPAGELAVLVNHFKSKGYSTRDDPQGSKRRRRQARAVAKLYAGLRASGVDLVAVVGDLNDTPTSTSLRPLLRDTDLRDISEHPDFAWGERRGTYGGGNESAKIDYVLLSPALFERATGGGIWRKGVWHGPATKNPWELYPTLTHEVRQASDHAAIWADIDLG